MGVVGTGWVLLDGSGLAGSSSLEGFGAPTSVEQSVAILPFEDFSPKGHQECFAQVLSEETINAPAQIPDLKVAARTSTFVLAHQGADITAVVGTLGVANVLKGSVRKVGPEFFSRHVATPSGGRPTMSRKSTGHQRLDRSHGSGRRGRTRLPEPRAVMKKLHQWLTLMADLAVVIGIVFLAVELRQNTEAIQAQTRDSITEKQMEFYGWVATNPRLAEAFSTALAVRLDELDPVDQVMYDFFLQGVFGEWENSYYQFERGLFTAGEFSARVNRWRALLHNSPAARDVWARTSDSFSGAFGEEVARIVAEAGPDE